MSAPLAFGEGHIDGAVLWNVYSDLKDANYQLVDKPAIEQLLAHSGIEASSTVVIYGYAPAMGFWLTKLYGHRDVGILDCSSETWRTEGRPWTKDAPTLRVTPPTRDASQETCPGLLFLGADGASARWCD